MRDPREGIRRDLELLLNTRHGLLVTRSRLEERWRAGAAAQARAQICAVDDVPDELPEVRGSILCYGIPDVCGVYVSDHRALETLRRAIQATIERHETRLANVQVRIEPSETNPLRVCFRIEGRIRADGFRGAISLDTVLDLGAGKFLMKE